MKKFLALVLALVMVLAMCVSASAAEAEEPYLVFVSPLLGNAVWDIAHNAFLEAIEDNGWNGEVVGPTTVSPEEMANLLDIAIAQGAKGVLTQGLMPGEAVDRAVEDGVTIMFVDGDNKASGGTFAFVGKDMKKEAELFYEEVCKQIGQDEKIVLSIQKSVLATEVDKAEVDAVDEVFSKHPGGYERVNLTLINSDTAKGVTEWENTFNTYPEINVCLNCCAEAAQACCKAADEKGITDDLIILGVDDLDVTLDLIREGKCDGTVAVSFWAYGYQSAVWLHEHVVEGRNPENRENPAALLMVTPENIDTYGAEMKTFEHLPE
ncbi:MAG: substrate-binding domain-containing protein [Eubacteriales bacterium]|nr:substrate-binding domain-containing protein [Eubacteriales bacterium]